MNIPAAAWPLIMFAIALFLVPMVALGTRLQRAPTVLMEEGAVVLLILLVIALSHGGHEPLEDTQPCPSGTNLAGCPGYVAPVIDKDRDIPLTPAERGAIRPDGTMPLPSWAVQKKP